MFRTELSSPNLLHSRQLADDSPVLSTPLMGWVPYSLLEMQASSIRQNITYMDRQLLKNSCTILHAVKMSQLHIIQLIKSIVIYEI